jgi:hypothetical protein
VPLSNRDFVDTDDARSRSTSYCKLLSHILLLELFDRMPTKVVFLSYLFDGRVTAPPAYMICEPFRVERIVGYPVKFFLNYLTAFFTLHSTDFQFEEDSSIAAREVSHSPYSAIVPSSVDSLTATANRFFERRVILIIRAPSSHVAMPTARLG